MTIEEYMLNELREIRREMEVRFAQILARLYALPELPGFSERDKAMLTHEREAPRDSVVDFTKRPS